jgi:hypothetical protein
MASPRKPRLPGQRKPRPLNAEKLLEQMKVGKTYHAYQLAVKFNLSSLEIRPLLDSLIGSGKLEVGQVDELAGGYRRPHPGTASESATALPRTFAVQHGELTGYEAEFARRVALCLSVRG